jgi:hypothetical protein
MVFPWIRVVDMLIGYSEAVQEGRGEGCNAFVVLLTSADFWFS